MKKVTRTRLMAPVAVLAITILTLMAVSNVNTTKGQVPSDAIDLTKKIKDKTFSDGRRVVIDTLPSGQKIAAEIKGGDFQNWFLIRNDGTEVQGELKRHRTVTTTTVVCTATMVTTTAELSSDGKKSTQDSRSVTIKIPCPKDTKPPSSNSNSNSNSNTPNS